MSTTDSTTTRAPRLTIKQRECLFEGLLSGVCWGWPSTQRSLRRMRFIDGGNRLTVEGRRVARALPGAPTSRRVAPCLVPAGFAEDFPPRVRQWVAFAFAFLQTVRGLTYPGLADATRTTLRLGAFLLHQAAEFYLSALIVSFPAPTRAARREARARAGVEATSAASHSLPYLRELVSVHVPAILDALPRTPGEEERLFRLLDAAYSKARYGTTYAVTVEDVDALRAMVERIEAVARTHCRAPASQASTSAPSAPSSARRAA